MAVQFTKNVANYVSLPQGTIGGLINGLAKFSAHAWVWVVSGTTGANDNSLLTWLINLTTVGGSLSVSGAAGALKVRATARSVNTDTRQAFSGATTVGVGAWHGVGAVWNISGDSIRVFLDGVLDGTSGVLTFANAAYTNGAPTNVDTIGGLYLPTPGTADQLDGNIAELALWNDDIGDEHMLSLGDGYDPRMIRPSNLIEHWSMFGPANLTGTRRKTVGTVNGSIPQSTVSPHHPRIIRP